jgi:UDP-N-acetylmuramoylalanine--D-glutamate ligase
MPDDANVRALNTIDSGYRAMITDFRGMRVTVMGLGSFGGGVGAVRFLAANGAQVTVTDLKPAAELAPAVEQIADCPNVVQCFGEHREIDFRETDLVVASPAVAASSPFLQVAREAGIPITSEMNLFWERNRGRTICVTGSNGKSTTAALIHALLSAAQGSLQMQNVPQETAGEPIPFESAPGAGAPESGVKQQVWLGGNIGKSLLPFVDQIKSDDWVVLELSSFQLESLAVLEPNPHIAVVTNFTPNHLERHETVDAYRAAKQNILRWQTPDRFAVLNQSDGDVRTWPTNARKFWFGRDDEGRQGMFAVGFDTYKRRALFRFGPREQVLPLGRWLELPGVHNFQNALAASCTALLLGTKVGEIETALTKFTGLPHRLQLAATTADRQFYNDSKATTPEAAMLALESFRSPVVLLAGGYDKGIDLSRFASEIVNRRVRAVALLGQTGEKLKWHIEQAAPAGAISSRAFATLEAAFDWAVSQSAPGDVVLLSPGCASYDWFPNYEARGDAFTRLARRWNGT